MTQQPRAPTPAGTLTALPGATEGLARPVSRIVLARRPSGAVQPEDFRTETTTLPPCAPGDVLVAIDWLSLDPYMRGRMDDGPSYATPLALDSVVVGGAVGTVCVSNNPDLPPGTRVNGLLGWQEVVHVPGGRGLQILPAVEVPPQAWLGALGMPGITAWYGLNRILRPEPGTTLCVNAAAGAVGSVVGQLARAAGCRVVGIAGGARKCRHVVEQYGFDACVDHRSPTLRQDLKAAAPNGIDLVFENVGGAVLDATLACMNDFGRIALCGLIAGYNGEDIGLRQVRALLTKRILIQGFIVSDHLADWPLAQTELIAAWQAGRLKSSETVAEGLASAPQALISLLSGGNLGKQLVHVGATARLAG